ncbi:LapA family protein [Pseudomonas sp. REP124]|uniref:LapA family protein n=1 Tax=Pseudomonas sp. REP124 TaxID=2875731 RepID=UPI001CCA5F8D|nr:LapA family protein [Pseudomonas sp. REP124]MBZ9782653.1 LapA family protein [Pseudomonas sp. REP124]
MNKLRRWFFLLILLLASAALIVFVLENQQSVKISFFGFSSGEAPASLCLVIALLVGMAIGPVVSFMLKYARNHDVKI